MRAGIGAFGLLFLLAGCTDFGPSQVAPPNAISVKSAFDDVADGLTDFRAKVDAPDPTTGASSKLGLITCRVIIHFNISASAKQSDGIGATLAAPIQAVKASVNYQEAEEAAAARGNSVLVDLGSVSNDTCSTYEKQSDMFPPPASAASKSDQSNTQAQDKGQQTTGGSQTNGPATTSQGNAQHAQDTPGTTTPTQKVAAVGSLFKMLQDECAKGDKKACAEIQGFVMDFQIKDPQWRTWFSPSH